MKTLLLVLWLASTASAQVMLISALPTLAPHDCYCGTACKCNPCECNVAKAAPEVSVKKPAKVSPDQASVKLGIKVGNTESLASGTVIESDGSKTKVLTCWHLLRDTGPVQVYLPSGRIVPAVVLKSNSKLDLALIEFDGSHDYSPVAKTYANDNLTAYGYEGGGPLKSFTTRIKRYYNYPDAVVEGQAKPGRSGGGLFNKDGELVGVCSGADQQVAESVYITHPAVEVFLTGKSTLKAIPAANKASPFTQNCPNGQCNQRR